MDTGSQEAIKPSIQNEDSNPVNFSVPTTSNQSENSVAKRAKIESTPLQTVKVEGHLPLASNETKLNVATSVVNPATSTIVEQSKTFQSLPVIKHDINNNISTSISSAKVVVPNTTSSLVNTDSSIKVEKKLVSPITQRFIPAATKSINTLPPPKEHRLVLLYDTPRYYHIIMQLKELREMPNSIVTVIELSDIDKVVTDEYISKIKFDHLNICIEYNDEFERNLQRFIKFMEDNPKKFQEVGDIGYHIHFAPGRKWKDYQEVEVEQYKKFLEVLGGVAGDKISHCSIINKYDMDTVYLTEKNELAKLGQEIQEDISRWKNLKVLDYGESSIRFLPGVKLPDSLEVLNIGGGYALETLTGFKMPPKLRTLLAGQGSVHNIDNIQFPDSLERLELEDNKIYFLNYAEFPSTLKHLDISQNRIESLRGVVFPNRLTSLNIGFNPIDSIKGVKFPETLIHLEVSNIPNESMTGVKFPDSLQVLNLQTSMTSTRGLKLPPYVKTLILAGNGVNSINPLKLSNTIEVLYLNDNNIKTLNKVVFPSSLRELYLGDNLLTTLKNVNFPPSLEILDLDNDPDSEDHDKYITTLKDVIFPPNLKVLKLGYHAIKVVEGIELPTTLTTLSLSYNDLRVIRNVRFGNQLKLLDLSGNPELSSLDNLMIPDSLTELRISAEQVNNLPSYIVERANQKQLLIKKSIVQK
ncbi:hypothetical protein DFJ63DRAFT_319176 [Scheffersomyces coipomensis]|uniref:uncharacterized protein n=1 Tax=Scheffersomyces coipomensis TaxID=1788519 RepID=UPI00315D9334